MERIFSFLRTQRELLRLMPDLSLRMTFVIIALCAVASAFVLGDMHGRSVEAESQLSVQDALPFVAYDPQLLKRQVRDESSVIVSSEKNYVASANGKLYYPANCKAAARIKEENRMWFATVAEAKANGLTLAKNCL